MAYLRFRKRGMMITNILIFITGLLFHRQCSAEINGGYLCKNKPVYKVKSRTHMRTFYYCEEHGKRMWARGGKQGIWSIEKI